MNDELERVRAAPPYVAPPSPTSAPSGAGDAVPAPGRQLPGWENEALDQMAAHLLGLGFEVLDGRPAVEEVPNDWGDPTFGGLRVRRYGWEATGVVRLDSTDLGSDLEVASIGRDDLRAFLHARHHTAAAKTWNLVVATLGSFFALLQPPGLGGGLAGRRPPRRRERADRVQVARTRAIPLQEGEAFLGAPRHALRAQLLWRMLYETAARARSSSCSTSGTSTWPTSAPW